MGLNLKEVASVTDEKRQYSVYGRERQLQPGDPTPEFKLRYFDLAKGEYYPLTQADLGPAISVIYLTRSVTHTPSMDAIVDLDINRKNTPLSPEDLKIITVTLDNPIKLAQQKKRRGIRHFLASASMVPNKFGGDFGALITRPKRFLTEAVIISAGGTIQYTDYPENLAKRPNFWRAFEVIQAIVDTRKKEAEDAEWSGFLELVDTQYPTSTRL